MNTLKNTLKLIKPTNKTIYKETSTFIDQLTKPIGSLGKLESITSKMMSILGKMEPIDFKKTTIIMCADNGVVEEGVSACPQSVTYTVTENFTKDITGICNLSTFFRSETTIIDIG
ncbi:MAG TPA: nicotinate-nucleotide--dimethylbenzimidazole phosphoribosyltransferase, partial [Epulopiscium sp.]|nr:nicotinate-nucleotide--dimethylbenzimidazole phosphoribosyltransferase [Candidatus Epulonipiscium sp.]